MFHATLGHQPEHLWLLLDRGADINAQKDGGVTALHKAAEAQHSWSILRLLLDKGADIEARDNYGRTPLLRAALSDRTEHLKLLLERGADIDAADSSGETALHHAAWDPECVALLVNQRRRCQRPRLPQSNSYSQGGGGSPQSGHSGSPPRLGRQYRRPRLPRENSPPLGSGSVVVRPHRTGALA